MSKYNVLPISLDPLPNHLDMASLRIAICGGGIASICLAHALTIRHPDWEVKIFEASSTKREQSAAVGLGSNAQEALAMISPDLRKAVDEAGGVRMDPSARIMMVCPQR